MAFNNLISVSFTADEVATMQAAIQSIRNVINNKVVSLKPEQRQQYGRLNDGTEQWVNNGRTFMEQMPQAVPFYLDKAELDRDLAARKVLNPILKDLTSVFNDLSDTQVLLGADVYQSMIAFYRNVKTLTDQNVPGARSIYESMSAFFDKTLPKTPEGEPMPNTQQA